MTDTQGRDGPTRWDPAAGGRLRGFVCFLPSALFAFGLAGWMLLLASVAPGTFRRQSRGLMHRWGRGCLWFFGIQLETSGLEHLEAPGARIVLFNHQSLLDLFVLTALWPRDAVVVYKQEFHKVPIIGRLMRALEFIPVDRSDRDAAIRSMHAAGVRVRERGEMLLVAPEGTRSRTDGLLPFKRGPFHLATETGLPLVPFVMQGVRRLMPAGRLVARSGVLRVDALPPISTKAWVVDELDRQIEDVRRIFLDYLPAASTTPDDARTSGERASGTGPDRTRHDTEAGDPTDTTGDETDSARPETTAAR